MKKTVQLVLCLSLALIISIVSHAQEAKPNPAQKPKEKSPQQTIMEFIRKGDAMMKTKQFDKAILEYSYALALSDTITRAHFSTGRAHFSKKDVEKAIASFEKTLSLNEGYMQAYNMLIKCYKVQKNMEGMFQTMDKMAEISKDNVQRLKTKLKIAQYYIKENDFDKAKQFTSQAIEIDKTNLDALYFHASVSNGLEMYEDARKAMESATSTLNTVDPKVTAKLFYELGYAYHHLKMYDKSAEALKNADFGPFKLLVAKLTPDYYQKIAMSYTLVYDFQSAVAMLEQALTIDPKLTAANKLMADITLKTDGYSQKALDFYQKAISCEEDPKHAVGLYEKVIELMLNAQKYKEAISMSDQCLSKVSNARNILFMKSIALFHSDQASKALVIIEQLLKDANLTPIETVKYQLVAGKLYAATDAIEKAQIAYKQSGKGPFMFISMHEKDKIKSKRPAGEKAG